MVPNDMVSISLNTPPCLLRKTPMMSDASPLMHLPRDERGIPTLLETRDYVTLSVDDYKRLLDDKVERKVKGQYIRQNREGDRPTLCDEIRKAIMLGITITCCLLFVFWLSLLTGHEKKAE
ncbi:hypothetical protein PROFUN_00785 [Planoprotostelium fungivorum]|uniref:Uncharacterized protein n=1 Tax=Planoprotostelium fungivorum TaxID=1890364 RepID=A0A2P6NZY2_9EUKA|nr:hypothetical protein PROFUN_00785 [Planoprotostelium fungivorum]